VAQQPKSGPGRLIIEVFRSHKIRYALPVGLLRTSDQPDAKTTTYTTQNKNKERTSRCSAGFEPAIPAIEQHQTYVLDLDIAYSVPCMFLPLTRLSEVVRMCTVCFNMVFIDSHNTECIYLHYFSFAIVK
jgi:hypothetical protein